MVCIYCGGETDVYNTRPQLRINNIWRRRRCRTCGAQFTTIEQPDYSNALRVQKSDGAVENFSHDKLQKSLYNTLLPRADALDAARELSRTIIGHLLKNMPSALIPSKYIRQVVAKTLKRFDSAAYVRYSAFKTSATNIRELKKSL